ncbi:cellulose biosynthesis cyclic di-GMP-binding regulatory protein BcsB [Ideonella sp. B508-1]|uniref:cellulose biosynthesis cyclic di-GMP-binding regulatory protein BcsB n=1 Tax=Ideonella sp. B508-1 TaxID=137716 RepID=UPI000344FE4B|nr:cellulose biosynthesis cyclic di-GMP-binding regulatory protein BcsB [Ideonella sp. B508-1]
MTQSHRALASAVLLLGAAIATSPCRAASPLTGALQQLQGDTWVTRSFTLADLGITQTVLMSGFDSRQEFFVPVPRSVPIAEAGIDFKGRYYKAEEGRTSVLLSVNGRPSHAQQIESAEGDAGQVLKVDPRTITGGFLRLGVNWVNNVTHRICEVDRATGNVLAVEPDTRISYRFASSALNSLSDAWVALPPHPTLLVAGKGLSKSAYDSAWRLGVALDHAGRPVTVKAFPAPGDTVDTQGWQVPPALAALPAFAALGAGESRHVLKNAAEVGALVLLGSGAASGDVVVMDGALRQQINAALDAVAAQWAGDSEAARVFADWRARQRALTAAGVPSHQVQLATLGGRPVIVVAEDGGAQAAGAFEDAWRNMLVGANAVIDKADTAQAYDQALLRPTQLGGSSTNFNVVATGDWTVTLPLAAVSADGRMPSDMSVDVAAAPGASSTRPVASVFWNDNLLGARQLQADGHAERIDVSVPSYVLGLRNVLRVSFQRQPYSKDCNELPQAFPVQVLPSTVLRTTSARPDGSFVGLLPLMADQPQVAVPESFLADAPASLGRLIRLAGAVGVSPVRAELVFGSAGKAFSPTRPFLAVQQPVDGDDMRVEVKQAHLRLAGREAPWLDVGDVARLSAAEVTEAHGQPGILWQPLGTPAAFDKPFLLNRGDVAVLSNEGPVAWLDSRTGDTGQGHGLFGGWLRWGVTGFVFALLLLLALLLVARRLKRRQGQNPSH